MNKYAEFLNTIIPTEIARSLCNEYELTYHDSMTFRDALNAALLREVKKGSKEAAALAEKHNIHE